MTKPNLSLGFTDTFENCEKFFTDILSRRFNIIRDDTFPDYLIFGDPNFGQNHYTYNAEKVTKIFYTGENARPNYYTYDHAITFDFENSPRHYRLPLYAMEMWAVMQDDKFTEDYFYLKGLHKRVDWEKEFDTKTEQISYIQSNPRCEPRNEFVQILQKNFTVNCGGPHMNNIGRVIPRNRLAKMDYLRQHKLNVAFENGSHPGYVTEKLLDAFYSNTLPIYWGSENVERDFNTKSFMNLGIKGFYYQHFGSDIRKLLNDKQAWCNVMSQPRFNYDIPNDYTNMENFLDWFCTNVYKG